MKVETVMGETTGPHRMNENCRVHALALSIWLVRPASPMLVTVRQKIGTGLLAALTAPTSRWVRRSLQPTRLGIVVAAR